jgi:hypothetical protein
MRLTICIPMPPPPPAAFTSSGKPTRSASAVMAGMSAGEIGPSLPGGGSTWTARAAARALILSPKASSAAGGGPMNVMPAAATASAKARFSLSRP